MCGEHRLRFRSFEELCTKYLIASLRTGNWKALLGLFLYFGTGRGLG